MGPIIAFKLRSRTRFERTVLTNKVKQATIPSFVHGMLHLLRNPARGTNFRGKNRHLASFLHVLAVSNSHGFLARSRRTYHGYTTSRIPLTADEPAHKSTHLISNQMREMYGVCVPIDKGQKSGPGVTIFRQTASCSWTRYAARRCRPRTANQSGLSFK